MDTTSVYKYTIQQTENTLFKKKSDGTFCTTDHTEGNKAALNPEQTNKPQNKN